MDKDSKGILIVLGVAAAILYFHSQSRDKHDTEQQVIGMVRQFCKAHGGIGKELTGITEGEHGHFTVECEDGSIATGFYKYPEQIIYRDKYSNKIKY